ncbi:hypothetical protein BJX68DRAFT_54292 [Aspergillus pseudodeflectus]|uniref:S-adenosyl-L-methionine-dependent methyltransferase n=1 Tax=Aspergillus pseudodeflectus TaxID=176178 RepID=A0ABR4KMU5_9EURO
MTLFPRIHIFEFIDQPWSSEWYRVYAQSMLVGLWHFSIPGITTRTSAAAASETILDNFPDLSSFIFVELCAGAGGPTTYIEPRVNNHLKEQGKQAVQFVLTDLYPVIDQWDVIAKRQGNISYVEKPLDAVKCKRIAARGRKECRMLNASFHHFDDEAAVAVLGAAIQEADAFLIQEGCARNLTSVIACIIGSTFYPFVFTIASPQFRRSPVHLLFTYLIPLIPLMLVWDALVSAGRARTPREIAGLVERTGLDVSEWELRSGECACIPGVFYTYWFLGIKKDLGLKPADGRQDAKGKASE